jgi:hypothetical protein
MNLVHQYSGLMLTDINQSCQAHLQLAHCHRTIPKAAKEPASRDCFIIKQSLKKKASLQRDNFKNPKPNSVGLINCLPQPRQLRNQPSKSMRENLSQLIKLCCKWTDSATETKSIGLRADAQVPCFLLAIWTI